jgi:hypothetical protein
MNGYVASQNEHQFQNVRVNGALVSQNLRIKRHDKGPILELNATNESKCNKNDIILIKKHNGDVVFKITYDGEVYVNNVNITNISSSDTSSHANNDDNINTPLIANNLTIENNVINLGENNTLTFGNEGNNTILNKDKLVLNTMESLDNGVYLGDPKRDNSWKISVSETGDLVFLKKVGGDWIFRQCIN